MDLEQYYKRHGGTLERNPALTYGYDCPYYGFDFGQFISKISTGVEKITKQLPAISVSSKKGTFSSGPQGLQWTSIPKTTTALTPSEAALIQQQATTGPDLMKWLPLAIPVALFFLKK